MATEQEPSGPGERRVEDAHRDAAIDALRTAAAEGLIDLEEFGDRAGAVYATDRLDEIRALLADLPVDVDDPASPVLATGPSPGELPPPPPPPPTETQYVVAVMSGATRRGTWRAKSQVNAVAIMGACTLDFRHAELSAPVTHVSAVAIMGGVDIVVPEGVPVEVDGFVLMGGIEDRTRTRPAPGQPMLKVKAYGIWGGVTVRPPRRRKHRRHDGSTDIVATAAEPSVERPVVGGDTLTLMFTDLIESTAMAQSLGDHRWFEVLRQHNALLRDEFQRCGGQEIKGQGDGFMVSFASSRRALLCAIGIQRSLAAHRDAHPETALHVRIGLNSGEVISDDGDLFGRNVIVASRIAAAAGNDQILASAVTKQLAESGGDLHFGAGQVVDLRGLPGEWEVYEVQWC